MSEQLREYVEGLKALKLKLQNSDKKFHILTDDIGQKYQSFYSVQQNYLHSLNLSREAIFMDADIDTYVKWLLSNDNIWLLYMSFDKVRQSS